MSFELILELVNLIAGGIGLLFRIRKRVQKNAVRKLERQEENLQDKVLVRQMAYARRKVGGNAGKELTDSQKAAKRQGIIEMASKIEDRLNEESLKILFFLKANGPTNTNDLSKSLGISRTKVRMYLSILIQLDLLKVSNVGEHVEFSYREK
jgi:predicted HTH transcriptional regulator